jgi:hypothetical protein
MRCQSMLMSRGRARTPTCSTCISKRYYRTEREVIDRLILWVLRLSRMTWISNSTKRRLTPKKVDHMGNGKKVLRNLRLFARLGNIGFAVVSLWRFRLRGQVPDQIRSVPESFIRPKRSWQGPPNLCEKPATSSRSYAARCCRFFRH